MFKTINVLSAALIGVFSSLAAQADVIDFEDVAALGFLNTAVSGGFSFSTTANEELYLYNGGGACSGGCWNNGSNVLAVYDSTVTTPIEMTMTRVGGGAFNLKSFDTAPLFDSIGDSNQSLSLTGFLAGGGSVAAILTFDGVTGSQVFSPMFSNVTSVSFSSNAFWFSVDNMHVSEVPVPAGFALLLTGLGAFGVIRGRRGTPSAAH